MRRSLRSAVLLCLATAVTAAPVPPPKVRPSLPGTWRAVWGLGRLNRIVTFKADGTFLATDLDTFLFQPEGRSSDSVGTWALEGDKLTITERYVWYDGSLGTEETEEFVLGKGLAGGRLLLMQRVER